MIVQETRLVSDGRKKIHFLSVYLFIYLSLLLCPYTSHEIRLKVTSQRGHKSPAMCQGANLEMGKKEISILNERIAWRSSSMSVLIWLI